ncbi:hypothetical protein AG1IA_05273 [Rhizoctonia solani AG-1 IA]|uniref:Uncharacterized protein n=2 Tax=Rhizoctonia solani TaxID=456999 RepID=A0A8H7H5L2_9AGAM|nr:hypothetical protein AG1IA_05273 [Rhizoctonia solani AG-1 IA]KAF8673969.1 hypothetical protein RHS04_07484 [Rhizoctonia solani]CAE6478229.1 unnamed protein product [Rhizoctonia solani]
MPIAHRRPGLLHLVMPHPALDQTAASSPSSTVASPHTPRRTPRHLPESLPHTRTSVASDKPRSSIDSWNSVDTNELVWEWKDEELELLSRTLDNIPSHLMTPYVGVVPPPNVLDKLARDIALSRNALEWPHSVRATRVKLHELCRRKTVKKAIDRRAPPAEPTPRNTVEVVSESAPPRRPLYRQSSMDFLPVKEVTSVTRLSSRLQRPDRTVPHASFHPYSRPSDSRSPTPPLTESIASRPRTRSSTPSDSSSLHATSPRGVFRSSATPPPLPLKRAPAFSAATVQTRVQRAQSCTPPEPGPYSSDEEEKARQASAKRPRTTARRVPSFLGAPLPPLAPSPEEEILDPLVAVPEDPVFAPTIRASDLKVAPTPRRSATKSTRSTTNAAPVTPAPVAVHASTASPRTLRRVGTRDFPTSISTVATIPFHAPVPATSRVAQGHRTAANRASATQPRTSTAGATSSSNERRTERRSRRDKEAETQLTQDSSRKIKKKSATLNMKDTKPSVVGMRL